MLDTIETVLVPVDGSDHANTAAHYGDRLARAAGARMELLHVFEDTPGILMQRMGYTAGQAVESRVSAEAFDQMRQASARRAFEKTRASLPEDADVTDRILSGDPADAVSHYAAGMDNAVIVMGRRGAGQIRELLMGSVSEGVIHQANCPVTVITHDPAHPEYSAGGSVLIVPVDESEQSLNATRYANTVATATGAVVHLLHVFPASPREIHSTIGTTMVEISATDAFEEENFRKIAQESAAATFAQAREQFDLDTVAVEDVRRPGQPAAAIINHARATANAEVIMARHGHGRIREFLLGSVSQRVLHAAHCPVTVVH
ncbi:universal stress protein [Aquisalimonas sp.]|uniref:universal stress protein n=1 Tax=Aquisalimonas sp. TaxID=1872621 RepID=UPI0025BE23B4|nr:universal stress protein [Aquisalimonas sp.]